MLSSFVHFAYPIKPTESGSTFLSVNLWAIRCFMNDEMARIEFKSLMFLLKTYTKNYYRNFDFETEMILAGNMVLTPGSNKNAFSLK